MMPWTGPYVSWAITSLQEKARSLKSYFQDVYCALFTWEGWDERLVCKFCKKGNQPLCKPPRHCAQSSWTNFFYFTQTLKYIFTFYIIMRQFQILLLWCNESLEISVPSCFWAVVQKYCPVTQRGKSREKYYPRWCRNINLKINMHPCLKYLTFADLNTNAEHLSSLVCMQRTSAEALHGWIPILLAALVKSQVNPNKILATGKFR